MQWAKRFLKRLALSESQEPNPEDPPAGALGKESIMPISTLTPSGVVEELWHYPVRFMLGEQLTTAEVTESGLLGDRAYALRDVSDGKIATAKNPRKWPIVRREHRFFRGRYLTTAGDGFLTAFDHAANEVDCGSAILRNVNVLGLKMRIRVHAGECFDGECLDMSEQFMGLTVHVGARIAAMAAANEVPVSDSGEMNLTDSGLHFLERGMHKLKGVPGEWRLFEAK